MVSSHRTPGSGSIRGDVSAIRDRAMMEVLYSTALRRMELVRLKACDVSVDAAAIFVRSGKGGHDRVVPLGVRACAWLVRYEREVRPALASGRGPRRALPHRFRRALLPQSPGGSPALLCRAARASGRVSHLPARLRDAHARERRGHPIHPGDARSFATLDHADLHTVSISKLREIHAATHPSERRRQGPSQNATPIAPMNTCSCDPGLNQKAPSVMRLHESCTKGPRGNSRITLT
jgi:integrase/recombinase XerD